MSSFRIYSLAILAMIAFAANSIFNRLALVEGEIGAWGFTFIRIVSGALFLMILLRASNWRDGRWTGALALLGYAGLFSLAYIALNAGLGALILFAFVQITMICWGLKTGERLSVIQWMGLLAAIAALVWLLAPGAAAPPLLASLTMALAGIAWGIYSLLGRGSANATALTAGNFTRASLITLLLSPLIFYVNPEALPSMSGVMFALASGTLSSALGYTIWYICLPNLRASEAGAMQLTVPIIAAASGIAFLGEPVTPKLVIASLIILGGVACVTFLPKPKGNSA